MDSTYVSISHSCDRGNACVDSALYSGDNCCRLFLGTRKITTGGRGSRGEFAVLHCVSKFFRAPNMSISIKVPALAVTQPPQNISETSGTCWKIMNGRGRARAAARTQDLPNYSGTCLTQSTWNVIVQSGWGEHGETELLPLRWLIQPYCVYFQSLRLLDPPRSTKMNETDMSAVLLIIISIRLIRRIKRQPRRQRRCEKCQTHWGSLSQD